MSQALVDLKALCHKFIRQIIEFGHVFIEGISMAFDYQVEVVIVLVSCNLWVL